jgi:hypothetical protein
LRNTCSGVAQLSGSSQPRRRMMFIVPPEFERGHE